MFRAAPAPERRPGWATSNSRSRSRWCGGTDPSALASIRARNRSSGFSSSSTRWRGAVSAFLPAGDGLASFAGADLRNASLFGAKLQDADFSGADLRDATLDSAVFEGTDLSNARLDDAFAFNTRFLNVRIDGADFTNVPLRGDALKRLCAVASGTNPSSGRATRDTLGCA